MSHAGEALAREIKCSSQEHATHPDVILKLDATLGMDAALQMMTVHAMKHAAQLLPINATTSEMK